MQKFEFLTSTRFYALVLGSAATVLLKPDFSTKEWYILLGEFFQLLAAGFILIRTTDRSVEYLAPATPIVIEGVEKVVEK